MSKKSWPILKRKLLQKMGQDFLDILKRGSDLSFEDIMLNQKYLKIFKLQSPIKLKTRNDFWYCKHDTYISWYLKACCASMKENRSFREKKNVRYLTARDLIKCLKQIKEQRLPFYVVVYYINKTTSWTDGMF